MAEPIIINNETEQQKHIRVQETIAKILEDEKYTIRITHVIDFIPSTKPESV